MAGSRSSGQPLVVWAYDQMNIRLGLVPLHQTRRRTLCVLGWGPNCGLEVRRRQPRSQESLQEESGFGHCVVLLHALGLRARCNQVLMSLLVQCRKAAIARTWSRVRHAWSGCGRRLCSSDRASLSHAKMSPSSSSFRILIASARSSCAGAEGVEVLTNRVSANWMLLFCNWKPVESIVHLLRM